MYGPGCVAILLLVVQPSNWFWRGQPPSAVFRSRRHTKFAPASARSKRLAPNPTSALVRAPLWQRVDSHTLFRGSAPWLAPALWRQRGELSLALSRRRVAFTPGFVLEYDYANRMQCARAISRSSSPACPLPRTFSARARAFITSINKYKDFFLQWRFAHAFCLTLRCGPQCLRFCCGGFLSPASELDASSALSQGRYNPCRRRRIRFLLRRHS